MAAGATDYFKNMVWLWTRQRKLLRPVGVAPCGSRPRLFIEWTAGSPRILLPERAGVERLILPGAGFVREGRLLEKANFLFSLLRALLGHTRCRLEFAFKPGMEKIQTGRTYVIRNTRSGTVIDLSGADNRSIIGYGFNDGPNQKWTVNWTGQGWTIRSVAGGAFLSPTGTPGNGTHLTASSAPFVWHIWHDNVYPGIYRIFAPNTLYNFDLWNYGDQTPGTAVTLWANWNGIHQLWDFTQV